MPVGRPMVLAAAVATALTLLTACGHDPLTQGTVKDKRGHAAHRTPTYTDTYRNTNCRTVTTNSLTLSSLTGRTTGGTGGGFSKPKPAPPAKNQKNPRTTKQVCDRVRVSHRQTGWRWNPAHWELKLKQGGRTEWVTVNKKTWDRARINREFTI
ncbi:hypothetical protein [Streptomyces anulatus]|uniref:hypothetical protein n=1 Tax=Streptomyces anulatus TaxID=1892 RepID=UPI001C26921D|nr:hypothetical protein [Streptomyces anulatus]